MLQIEDKTYGGTEGVVDGALLKPVDVFGPDSIFSFATNEKGEDVMLMKRAKT